MLGSFSPHRCVVSTKYSIIIIINPHRRCQTWSSKMHKCIMHFMPEIDSSKIKLTYWEIQDDNLGILTFFKKRYIGWVGVVFFSVKTKESCGPGVSADFVLCLKVDTKDCTILLRVRKNWVHFMKCESFSRNADPSSPWYVTPKLNLTPQIVQRPFSMIKSDNADGDWWW